MHLPTIRQLQYLIAVVELRHFGKAADRCFVTQSTLSAGIQELENLLGAAVLERSKRKVIPTPLGLDLVERAREVLLLSEGIVEQARGEHEPLTGPLRLGVIPTIGPFLLPKVLPTIRKKFRQLELFLIEDQTARLLERIGSGELDCAILALPYDMERMESQTFWSENFWIAFPKKHKLSEVDAVGTKDLPVDELLLLGEGHCFRDHALSACRREGLLRNAAFQGTSLYTLMEMVAGGQGVTFLPDMAIHSSMGKQRGVDVRPLDSKGPHRDIALVWRSSFYRKKDMTILAETMGEIAESAYY